MDENSLLSRVLRQQWKPGPARSRRVSPSAANWRAPV